LEDRVLNPQIPFPECVVLHVEDDDATAYLFQRALVESGTRVHIFRGRDGEEAISFLVRHGLYSDAPIPDLVVLDIGLPKKTGFDVLEAIRSEERLKDVAVVMLTASTSLRDRQKALRLGARDFFVKSGVWHEIIATGESVCALALNRASERYRVVDRNAQHVDYYLGVLGIRASESTCRLVARVGNAWQELGPNRSLPIAVPSTPAELRAARDDLVALIAWQYEHEHAWTDLRETLKAGWHPP
jgi:chemotaxis family two-component system response regulator Rcp1